MSDKYLISLCLLNFQDRKAMFDIAISGPTLGFIASLVLIFLGINDMSTTSFEVMQQTYPALPYGFFQSSFFLRFFDRFCISVN